MKIHEFALIIDHHNLEFSDVENIVFEAGFDDALLLQRNGITYIECERQGHTFESVVLNAIRQFDEKNSSLRIKRIEPADLVTSAEIARRLNRTRQSIQQMVSGSRGSGDFPIPIAGVTSLTMLWSWAEVAQWCFENGKLEDKSELEKAEFVRAINDLLSNMKGSRQRSIHDKVQDLLLQEA